MELTSVNTFKNLPSEAAMEAESTYSVMTAEDARRAQKPLLMNSSLTGSRQQLLWLASVPAFLLALHVFFAFVGQDWGWAFHTITDETTAGLARDRAFNSGLGRFFFVLFAGAYAFIVFRKVTNPVSFVQMKEVGLTDADVTRVEDCVNGVLDGWASHFKNESLEVPAYVGRDTQKASDTTKELISLTLEQVSNEVRTALHNELKASTE